MYIPRAFRQEDVAELVAFMRAHSFITLVSILDGAPFASHVPVVVRQDGDGVTLHGHLARANPHWHAFDTGESLAIFTGPHAYVSPSHYEQRESVPTWNYIAVHAAGPVRALHAADDRAALEREIAALIEATEGAYQRQWDSLPERYREGMLKGVVGFTLSVARLEGKAKLSQNRGEADRHRVAAALLGGDDPTARAVGAAMRRGLDNHEGRA
ncbi:MAG TPA: FMN-binding negative transcriptional regulator [Chloroflexaceae bacterium]|nr:FMN-binding negative transcriptional regulator [Chloroflexaceae bacterium]